MITLRRGMAAAAFVMLLASGAAQPQDLGLRPLRYGNTSSWYYDNRDDHRDYPTNGFFPGNFSADPPTSWLGISGALAGNSERSVLPYPSQVVIGPVPYRPPVCTCAPTIPQAAPISAATACAIGVERVHRLGCGLRPGSGVPVTARYHAASD